MVTKNVTNISAREQISTDPVKEAPSGAEDSARAESRLTRNLDVDIQ